MKTSCVIVLVLSCWVCPLNARQAFPVKNKVEAIAKTIYHEARGEGECGMRAVASTIYNRAVRKGEVTVYSLYAEAKRKYQFSCWNGKRDLPKGKDAAWETSMEIAIELYMGNFNPVHGHTHYYAYKKCNPKWARTAKSAGVKIGNHKFLTVTQENDVPDAGGNPLVCIKCDWTKEQIVAKMREKMNAMMESM